MRVVLQISKQASVTLNGETIASIDKGYVLLVGMTSGDDQELARKMVDKILKLRIFPDGNGKANLSLSAVKGNILAVSQFTLYGSAKEGNRPSFVNAMKAEQARELFGYFCEYMKTQLPSMQHNVFQTDCQVHIINDGPFTLILDSKELFGR